MQSEKFLEEIESRLNGMTIHEVRQTARVIRAHVTSGQKGAIIESILNIASGREEPAPATTRGAPPKSDRFDEKTVEDILSCREYCLATFERPAAFNVNDPNYEYIANSECEHLGVLDKEGDAFFVLDGDKLFMPDVFLKKYNLRQGDEIRCKSRRTSVADCAGIYEVVSVNGIAVDDYPARVDFSSLTYIYPSVRINLSGDAACRLADLFAPLAFGQRAVISSPPACGKTTLLKSIARGICSKYRDTEVVILTLGARPEEVTDFKKSEFKSKLFYTSFDKSHAEHYALSCLAFEYAKRKVEMKKNVVVLADGMSGALTAEEIKKFLYFAINAEEGESLTVVAALSNECNLSEVANMLITLSPRLAVERVFPAIDILKSYSCREEYLLTQEEIKLASSIRRRLLGGEPSEEIIRLFKEGATNGEIAEFLKNGR